jgi:hypothetical protein
MFHSFLLLLSLLMGGTAAGSAESESGGEPAPDAAPDAVPDAVPAAESDAAPAAAPAAESAVAGGGCRVSDKYKYTNYGSYPGYCSWSPQRFYSYSFRKRKISGMLLPRSYEGLPCACCDSELMDLCSPYQRQREHPEIPVCSNCMAPICVECSTFTEYKQLGRDNNRCKWCLTRLYPERKIVVDSAHNEDVVFFQQLDSAHQNFSQLDVWFRSIFRINRKFDFSKIWWIEMTGWRFFADGDWFFQQKLEHEFNIVMASMLFNNSKRVGRPVPTHFGVFYKQFHEDPTKYLLEESSQIAVMHSMAFKMLTRMEMRYCGLVLRRVESKSALLLQNGLGVNILPPKKSSESYDSEDDY